MGGTPSGPLNQNQIDSTAAETAAKKAAKAATIQKQKDTADTTTVSGRLTQLFAGKSDPKLKELTAGAQFGEAVIGEGLGRLSEDESIQLAAQRYRERALQADPEQAAIQQRLVERAKGLSDPEAIAMKEQAVQGLQANTEAQRRALQASLARSGVKGAAAGAQLTSQALGALQQRGELERDLLLKQREIEGQGLQDLESFTRSQEAQERQRLQDLAASATGIATFDIGQQAAEKNIALQSGLGFAELGAAERGAKLAARATEKAAASQSGGGGKK